MRENCCILVKNFLKFILTRPIVNEHMLVYVMAWCRTGAVSLPEPMMTPHWVYFHGLAQNRRNYSIYPEQDGHDFSLTTVSKPTDLIHKSQNAPVPYPTMLHSEQKCAHFCSELSIVGYGTGTFWDLLNWSIPCGCCVLIKILWSLYLWVQLSMSHYWFA